MKTSLLSLLAGTALLGGVGVASAAEPITLSSSEPVLLSPADMDQITAGGSWGREWRDFFRNRWEHKKHFAKFDHRHDHKKHDGKPSTPPAPSGNITVNVPVDIDGNGNVVNVQVVINNSGDVVQVVDVKSAAPAPTPPKKKWS